MQKIKLEAKDKKAVENFIKEIQKELPVDVFVVNIKLYETTNSYAEWRIEDHPSYSYDKFRKENVFYGSNSL